MLLTREKLRNTLIISPVHPSLRDFITNMLDYLRFGKSLLPPSTAKAINDRLILQHAGYFTGTEDSKETTNFTERLGKSQAHWRSSCQKQP